ncbi:uncharacterized protein LOC130968626 isoform X4 [Arachis stenosperma]|uniref:uncharacterized protein LOC130968626 isoform X4 n=1 Tax=Arachis stenosperma TaxID=217475 RepID=UPI0025AD37FC|nr:uncharacterized protein LOC130968626 isoform X4 [Arachis stenosperma]XP_057749987.1 uncharacterized protein LOC130968626 isoform X4 [Arachis stenosperma]
MDMYIRVKRSKTTYFIRCKPTDKILDIKLKLQELVDQPANNQRLIIPATGEVLEDSRTLADQKVENDAVVALTLRKDVAPEPWPHWIKYLVHLSAILQHNFAFHNLKWS